MLIKFADDRKLGGMANPTNYQIMIQSDLNRLQS